MTSSRVSPRWEHAQTVAGFAQAGPNETLVAWARERVAAGAKTALDIGCGAARNALPLAELGLEVVGTDLSEPMIAAARARTAAAWQGGEAAGLVPPRFEVAPMAPLDFADASFDLVVAHGVWNLATRDAELRAAMADAARVARRGAGLFLFTFSRHTLPDAARPVAGERYVFTDFAGEPQVFMTDDELVQELGAVGFELAPGTALVEHNRPKPGFPRGGGPVIWEGTFVRTRAGR